MYHLVDDKEVWKHFQKCIYSSNKTTNFICIQSNQFEGNISSGFLYSIDFYLFVNLKQEAFSS